MDNPSVISEEYAKKLEDTLARCAREGIRDDLVLEDYAEKLGYTVIRSSADQRRQKDGINSTCDSLSFEKGNKTIWYCIDFKTDVPVWRCADVIEGVNCNHRSYDDLKTALDTEQ